MAKTVAQRQADYRARRYTAGPRQNGERRLNMWISTSASLALARLSAQEGVSKRFIIQQLIEAADQKYIDALAPDTADWNEYFLVERVTQ